MSREGLVGLGNRAGKSLLGSCGSVRIHQALWCPGLEELLSYRKA